MAQRVKNLPAMQETLEMWVRSPGEGSGNPLQHYFLEIHGQRSLVIQFPWNPTDRGAWQATVQRVAKESDTTE